MLAPLATTSIMLTDEESRRVPCVLHFHCNSAVIRRRIQAAKLLQKCMLTALHQSLPTVINSGMSSMSSSNRVTVLILSPSPLGRIRITPLDCLRCRGTESKLMRVSRPLDVPRSTSFSSATCGSVRHLKGFF